MIDISVLWHELLVHHALLVQLQAKSHCGILVVQYTMET